MIEFAFSKDPLKGLRTRWQIIPDPQFELPEDDLLQRLLKTCYHTFLRSSGQAQ